jgi:hypothetical protein
VGTSDCRLDGISRSRGFGAEEDSLALVDSKH